MLSSMSRKPLWPAADLIVESWVPILPTEMPREAPTFYFSSSGLRQAALSTIIKHKEIVAGAAFEDIASTCVEFLRTCLWPQEYKAIRSADDTLLDAFNTDDRLGSVEAKFDAFVKEKFSVKLFMAPLKCAGANGGVIPPKTSSPRLTDAWISTTGELDKFLEGRFDLGAQIDLSRFPPERDGRERFETSAHMALTWLVTLERNEERALGRLTTLLGAICVALGPRVWPRQSSARFGGVAHLTSSGFGFGAFYRFRLPAIHGNAVLREERDATGITIHFEDKFDLGFIEQVASLGTTSAEARLRRATYFLGLAYRSDEIARYLFCASALDALFNFDGYSLEKTAKLGLRSFSGDSESDNKLSWLLAIRGRLAHGKRETPQEASHYVRYWRRYDQEPLEGFWKLVRASIVAIAGNVSAYEKELNRIRDTAAKDGDGAIEK